MKTLREQYDEMVKKRTEIIEQIRILDEDETVKKYLQLCNQNNELENQQKKLYREIKFEEYSSCNHIWVTALHDYDSSEGRSYNYHGCIKCGLDRRVFHLMNHNFRNYPFLSLGQQIMYDFFKSDYSCGNKEIDTQILCDLDLAKAIYSKIKKAHPDIDDETAIKCFEVALADIRNIKVSDERKVSRAKRLMLKPGFNSWTKRDVSR